MKRFFKILAILLLLGYLVASFVLWHNKGNEVVCQHFYITVRDSSECNLITSDNLYHYLRKAHLLPINKTCGEIDPSAIEKYVEQIDLLEDVECYYEQNGDVYLNVSQRRPFMRVMPDDGESYYLERNANHIAVDTMYVVNVPLVTGNVDDRVMAESLIPLVEYIVAHDFWCNQVAQIHVSQQHEVILSPRVGNHVILLGDADNYKNKLESVQAIYRQVLPEIGWNTYDTISMKYKDQVVCTRRDKKYRHNTWTKKSLTTYE